MNPIALFALALIPLFATTGMPRNTLLVIYAMCTAVAAFSGAFK